MIFELYSTPTPSESGHPDSPISNTTGELPAQEPELDLGNLLGSFSSREEALAFINQQVSDQNQRITDTQSAPFNEYTHIDWLTITIQGQDETTRIESYYLITDEGY